MNTDKIYLIGFMAAGKTSVARALGRRLGWRVEDVDELIETRERQPISEIFTTRGEPYFRAVERELVRELLLPRHTVVATGGGTFVDPESRLAISQDGASIWLDVPLATVIARLPPDNRRPLAGDRRQLEALYLARRVAYQQARFRIDAGNVAVDEIVERILNLLGY